MTYYYTPRRRAKIKRITTLSADKNVELWELSYIAIWSVNLYNYFVIYLAQSTKLNI